MKEQAGVNTRIRNVNDSVIAFGTLLLSSRRETTEVLLSCGETCEILVSFEMRALKRVKCLVEVVLRERVVAANR